MSFRFIGATLRAGDVPSPPFPLDRLEALRQTGVLGLDPLPVKDEPLVDVDAIDLDAQRLPVADVNSALTQAVQPGPRRSCRAGETCTSRGAEAAVNTESRCSRTSCLTSGTGCSGASLTLVRMKSGKTA